MGFVKTQKKSHGGKADGGRGGRMIDYGAFGGIPAVTKGKGVFSGKGEH